MALSAARRRAGVETITSLLENGESNVIFDTTGRRCIHCVASNGTENFQVLLKEQPGDLLIADQCSNITLHWAAQLGNAEPPEFILTKLRH